MTSRKQRFHDCKTANVYYLQSCFFAAESFCAVKTDRYSFKNDRYLKNFDRYSVKTDRIYPKMKTPCLPRRSKPRQTGLFCVYIIHGLNRQPSKIRINTKVSNFNTLYQNCSPKMARPKGFEPLFSGIGIRCVIQLRHGRLLSAVLSADIYYTILFRKNQSASASQIPYCSSCSFCSSSSLAVSSKSFS